MVITIFVHGGHLDHFIFLCPLCPTRLNMKFGCDLIRQAVSEEKMFENSGHMHVYIPRAGADHPLGAFSLSKL